MLRLVSRDMLEVITLIIHHFGQVVEVVVPVLLVVMDLVLHQTLVMVEQVFKF